MLSGRSFVFIYVLGGGGGAGMKSELFLSKKDDKNPTH